MKGYLMSLSTAEKFWTRCMEKNANTEVERMAILLTLLHEDDIRILSEKQMTDEIAGKKVIRVERKPQ